MPTRSSSQCDHGDALRLGRAIHRRQRNALARRCDRQRLDAIIEIVRQRRAAIDHVPHALEERRRGIPHPAPSPPPASQRRSAPIRNTCGRIPAAFFDRRLEQARHRPALVDVECAAERRAAVVEVHIAAGDVAPRHPVERLPRPHPDHGRAPASIAVRAAICAVICPWLCGVGFGMPVEPEVNRYLPTESGPSQSIAVSTTDVAGVSAERREGSPSLPTHPPR